MSTLKEVAQEAGVSISTVSRALCGNIPVKNETRIKIEKAIKKLNYQPNVLAKGLKEGRTKTLALIIPNIQNPFFPAVTRGVEDIAQENGYTLILSNTDESLQQEKEYIQKLSQRWVDGFILASAASGSKHIQHLKKHIIPTVLLARALESQFDTVVVDNRQGGYMGIEYLLDKGHSRIALILGSLSIQLYKDRYAGCCEALAENGVQLESSQVIRGVSGIEGGYSAMKKILGGGSRPTAVFCSSDPQALGAMRAIQEMGLAIPKDISVLGFDGLDISSMVFPALTTVEQPLYDLGKRAAQLVIGRIRGSYELRPQSEVLPVRIRERETVGVLKNKVREGLS